MNCFLYKASYEEKIPRAIFRLIEIKWDALPKENPLISPLFIARESILLRQYTTMMKKKDKRSHWWRPLYAWIFSLGFSFIIIKKFVEVMHPLIYLRQVVPKPLTWRMLRKSQSTLSNASMMLSLMITLFSFFLFHSSMSSFAILKRHLGFVGLPQMLIDIWKWW